MKPYWRAEGFNFALYPVLKQKGLDHPELWPGYNNACRERDRIRPHVEHGYYPERLFRERAPNQTEAEAKYMRDNFKQVTLSHYDDFENSVLRALNENNWSITYGKEDDEQEDGTDDYQQYVTSGISEFGSLFNYVRYVVPKVKTLDAMGLITVIPKLQTTLDEAGQEVVDPDGEVFPIPHYVPVSRVWGFEYDKWYMWLTTEQSYVTRGNQRMKEGLVLLMCDDTNFYRIEQVGEKYKFEFVISIWWEHGQGFAPAMHLRGKPKEGDNGEFVWQSPYLSATESFDLVLFDSSYLAASKAKCVFPHQVQIGDDCEFVEQDTGAACAGSGVLRWWDGSGDSPIEKTKPCPKCHGTGMKSRMGPLGTLLVRPPNRTDAGETTTLANALSFVSPDVTSLQFLRSDIDKNVSAGRAMLHLSTETQAVEGGDAKTATQSGIDLRANYAFIKPISDQIFDIFDFLHECIGLQRYGSSFTGVSITRPVSFDVRTETDMVEEIKAAKQADMPPAMLDTLIWNYAKARNQHDPEGLAVMETIAAADVLFSRPQSSIQFQLSQGLIDPWRVVLHEQAVSIYDELARQGKIVRTADPMKDVEANALAMQELAKTRAPKVERPSAQRLTDAIRA